MSKLARLLPLPEGPPGALCFPFPLPPNLANARVAWAERHQKRKAFYAASDIRLAAKLFPARPDAPWTHVTVTAHMRCGNTMDMDNLFARCKYALDWLRDHRYIAADDPKHLTWATIPTQDISRVRVNQSLTLWLVPSPAPLPDPPPAPESGPA